MIFKQLALLGLVDAHFKNTYSDPEFRQKLAKRLIQKNRLSVQRPKKTHQRNFSNGGGTGFDTSSGFLSAITAFSYCGEINSNSQFEILKDYLVENNGKKVFYSHLADGGNKIPDEALDSITAKDSDTLLTYGNGYCDKNVYKSWNKCAVSGKCYETCTDGNCYDEVRNNGREIEVPRGCNDVYLECAQQCSRESKCKAFTFRNTNVLGNGAFTCMLMDEIYCARSEFDHGDPRTVYHVKGSAIQELYNEYGVDNLDALDAAKFNVETDHLINIWSSWGWHHCWPIKAGEKCGTGFQKRLRTKSDNTQDIERRDCIFANAVGEMVECESDDQSDDSNTPTQVGTDPAIGHGWMDWGEWTPCSHSCGTNGKKRRTRRCGTCDSPDENGLCSNPTEALHAFTDAHALHCPLENQSDTATCTFGKCLPRSNGRPNSDPQQYLVLRGWQTYQSGTPTNSFADWEGGCVDYELESVGVKVKIYGPKQAFVECMKQCADAGADCLSVSYWPRLTKPYWQTFWKNDDFNCYLHKRRCHEDSSFRDASYLTNQGASLVHAHANRSGYQAAATSWYAYKDLCSNTMICDKQGPKMNPYYATICDSTGENAFPAQPVCSCPFSRDNHSKVRAWGNPYGWHYYNEETKRIEMRKTNSDIIQRPAWYSERKNIAVDPMQTSSVLPCHDPCRHNKCSTLSKCVFNPESPVGYNCECTWPSAIDVEYTGDPALAGFEGVGGCKPYDFRNSKMTDNSIMFGGGWNSLKKPGQIRPVKPSPQYYDLTATEDPWTFRVSEAMKIPAGSPTSKKGRFYNCIVNLDEKKQMFVGGKWGQFFDVMDDKTMVYEWNNTVHDGKWVGLDGQDIGAQECQGGKDESGAQHGCIRDGGWPDLPHTPISACQGQCRNGAVGYGPTNVHWINEYCNVKSDFWNPTSGEWESREFLLCDYKIEQNSSGEKIEGLSGKWIAVENLERAQHEADYERAVLDSIPFYGSERLEALDSEDHLDKDEYTQMIDGKRHLKYWRWKSGKQLPSDKFSIFHGIFSSDQSPRHGINLQRAIRTYHAYGQPLCGLVGDKVMTGSGRIARILSLSKDEEQVKKEKVWKIEEGSDFPEPRKKSNGRHCLSNDDFDADGYVVRQLSMDNRRQNFGTVVTTEGMWMIGGLFESASDLPTRKISKRFNIPGCTKTGHLNDVWVFNPKGWTRDQILGDSASKYSGMADEQVLPTISGYEFSQDTKELSDKKQTFSSFRLYDEASDGPTIQQALEEGWECTGIDGKWCRKPFLNRYTKGAESQVMCFEYESGTEDRAYSNPSESGNIQRRPRVCSHDETKNDDNNCICYIIQAAGQSGPKQTPDGAGFRPEIDYLEVRRADGTFGSDRAFYNDHVEEYCPEATATYPNVDDPIVHDQESAVSDGTQCTTQCGSQGQPACNRKWSKKNLRKRWHEAGRIRNGRMGALSGSLKGELLLWGGECYGGTTVRDFGPDGKVRAVQNINRPRPCRMQMLKDGTRRSGDYIEAFSFVRMNKAGFLFGEKRSIDLVGFPNGQASNDESAVSQAFSAMNTFHSQK